MKKIQKFIIAITLILCGNFVYAKPLPPSPAFPELSPVTVLENENKETEIEIETDTRSAEVYLNGVYQGRTNLKIKNLMPGFYNLDIRKPGFEDEHFMIEVKSGFSQKYSVHLREIFGTISFLKLPPKSNVYIDDYYVSVYTENVRPGFHKIRVKCFGYKDYVTTVEVFPHEIVTVTPEFEIADFEVKDFSANKKSFNPEYEGKIGTVTFEFYVTAPGTAKACIKDKSGRILKEYEWSNFTTWEKEFTWDGTDENGEIQEDGTYSVYLDSNDFHLQTEVKIDTSIKYSIASVNKNGTGIGTLPAVFSESADFIQPYLSVTPVIEVNNGAVLKNMSFDFAVAANFLEHNEVSFYSDVSTDFSKNLTYQLIGNYKLYDTLEVSDLVNFSYGGLLRFGYTNSKKLYSGIDCGNGLGGGILLGMDASFAKKGPSVKAALSSQAIFAVTGGLLQTDSFVWKNGLALMYKADDYFGVGIFGAIHSNLSYELTSAKSKFLRGIETGFDANYMIKGTSVKINLNGDALFIPQETNLLSFGLGVSYIF